MATQVLTEEVKKDLSEYEHKPESLVSDEILKVLFLSINFEASPAQVNQVRSMLELDLEVNEEHQMTPEDSAEYICNELNIPVDGNAPKIQAVITPLWEKAGLIPVEADNADEKNLTERFSAKKTAEIKRLTREIVLMDDNIARQQRELNSLREDRKEVDLKLLQVITGPEPDQIDLFDQEEEQSEKQEEPPADNQLTLPEINNVTCGMCAGVFQIAENQNEVKEGVAYVVSTLPKDMKKKFKKMEHVCGGCYFTKIG